MQSVEATRALHSLDRIETERLIRSLWAARIRDPALAIRTFCAQDIHFRVPGLGPNPQAPLVFEGHDAVIEAIRNIDLNLEFRSFEIVALIIDGDHAALRWHATVSHRGTGVVGELSVFDHIRISSGKIAAYTEFLDTDGFRKLMAGDPQPPFARDANRLGGSGLPMGTAANDKLPREAMTRAEVERLIRDFVAVRQVNGQDAFERYWTADCELQLIGDPLTVPFARRHVGREAVKSLIAQIDMEFAYISLDVVNLVIEGNQAALHWCAHVRHRGTGMAGFIEAFDHGIIEGGRLHRATEFFDTAQAASWIRG